MADDAREEWTTLDVHERCALTTRGRRASRGSRGRPGRELGVEAILEFVVTRSVQLELDCDIRYDILDCMVLARSAVNPMPSSADSLPHLEGGHTLTWSRLKFWAAVDAILAENERSMFGISAQRARRTRRTNRRVR